MKKVVLIVDETFHSCNERERRESLQKAAEQYLAFVLKNGSQPVEKPLQSV